MRAGQLDELVTAQTPAKTWSVGESVDTWAGAGTFWASVREQTGREAISAGQVDAEQPVIVTARFEDVRHITTKDRIVLEDGRVLDIQSAREVGRRQWREFLCVLDSDGGA